jgi:two-component system CheB/CheR fusion protein
MAFVVVQHLSPHHESFLPDVLASGARLPVAHAEKNTRIEPGHVYVVPPDRLIELRDSHLRLTPRPVDRLQYPINHFFNSLATFAQTRAIGIVLSGNASDGAEGLREIKARGGIAMAQDPLTAKFDSMPRAAIAAGVDFVLPPELLAEELIRMARHPVLRGDGRAPANRTSENDARHLREIFRILRENGGLDYSSYKTPTILRRLHRQMVLRRIPTLAAYAEFLRREPAEVATLGKAILIHVTRFFRDPEAFEALASFAGRLAQRRGSEDSLRIWVPGCSTGEEAYSIAMAVVERFGPTRRRFPIQIFGTDVSDDAIDRARRGVYPEAISADVSPERLRKFFTQFDDSYRISQSIRDLCVFARQDVTQDPPFSRLDLVLCRNLLIYLDLPIQKRILTVFYYALNPAGLLMLGAAESTGPLSECFEALDKKHHIYAKKEGKLVRQPRFTAGRFSTRLDRVHGAIESGVELKAQKDADRILLEKYVPPAVLLDDDLQIRQIRGQVGQYLAPSPGNASLGIFKMARPGLAAGLRSLLTKARETQKPVRRENLKIRTNSHVEVITIEILPIRSSEGLEHFLVLFRPTPVTVRGKVGAKSARSPAREMPRRIHELEDELEATRSELQSMIQDLEAANEELQSANEEILSSNEELQSTNEELDTAREELQSTNEEIVTVNEELHGRNEDLARVNSDLINLLASVQIAIVMVGGDMRIRRFTPLAERTLNLIPSDVGRPIGHIKPNVDCPTLESIITESLDKTAMVEREIQDFAGRWYSLKVRPYKNVDNRIDGAVIVLLDIDTVKRQQQEAAVIDAVVEFSRDPLVVLGSDLHVSNATWTFCRTFQLDPNSVIEQPFFEIDNRRWDVPALREAVEAVRSKNLVVRDFEVTVPGADGHGGPYLVNARKLEIHDGAGDRVLLAVERVRT